MVGEIIGGILSLAIQFSIFLAIYRAIKSHSVVNRSINQTTFYTEDEPYLKADEFFEAIKQQLLLRKIVGLVIEYAALKEATAINGSRMYLVLKKQDTIFYISTFPVGNTQVFSYWLVEPYAFWRRLLGGIPFLGKIILNLFFPNSLYKMDVASGLQGIIKADIKTVLDEIAGKDSYTLSSNVNINEIHKMIFKK